MKIFLVKEDYINLVSFQVVLSLYPYRVNEIVCFFSFSEKSFASVATQKKDCLTCISPLVDIIGDDISDNNRSIESLKRTLLHTRAQ